MPIEKVNGGYKWGKSGKVYPTKAQAAKQARAAYASGYKGYQSGGGVTQSTDPFAPNFELSRSGGKTTTVGGPRQTNKDTFAKDFAKYMLMTGIMSNPKARQNFMLAKMFRDQGPMGLGKALGQRAGIEALFRKVGPWGMLLQNKGGPLGLGIMSSKRPMSSRIMQGLLDPRVSGRLKLAQAFPGIFALGWGLNKFSPRIPGQTGAFGQGLGPQIANIFAPMFGTRTHEEAMRDFGPGIFGGTLGPRIRNFFGGGRDREEGKGIFGGTLGPKLREIFTRNRDESPIQEIEVTAQRRGTPEERARERARERAEAFNRSIAMDEAMLRGRIEETGGLPIDKLTGISPGAARSLNQGLRAGIRGRMLAKRAAARALSGREAKVNRSGLDPVTGKPIRRFSSSHGRK